MAKIFMVDDEPLLMESLEIILTYSGGHYICGFSFIQGVIFVQEFLNVIRIDKQRDNISDLKGDQIRIIGRVYDRALRRIHRP